MCLYVLCVYIYIYVVSSRLVTIESEVYRLPRSIGGDRGGAEGGGRLAEAACLATRVRIEVTSAV